MKLLWVIPLAMTVATAANVVFYYVVTAGFGEEPLVPNRFPPPAYAALPVMVVISLTVFGTLGAGIVFGIVSKLARRPLRVYLGISVAMLLLSFVPTLTLPSPPVELSHKLVLGAMHIIAAIAVVSTLIALGRGVWSRNASMVVA